MELERSVGDRTVGIAVALIATTGQAQVTMTTPDGTQVGVTFFNPRTVHITKTPKGKALRKSLVVTAEPQQVAVRRGESGSEVTLSSNELTVRVNKKTGRVAFEGLRLKNLLSEQDYSFEERTSGSDRGACRVNTTFRLQKDEPIYGLGTLQAGLFTGIIIRAPRSTRPRAAPRCRCRRRLATP